MLQRLSGVFCAFWTPADASGAIEWEAFDKNLEFVLKAGVHGIMALGSTAEFPHFNVTARKQILDRISQACKPRGLPIIANVSDVSCRTAVELACHAANLGMAVAAVLPPWYFPAEQRDLAEFFIRVGRDSGLPLGLYNFPEVTGKRLELETIQRVCERVPVTAVKQSGAEFDYHKALVELGRKAGFSVLTGSDTRFAEALRLGCTGAVSGLANIVPERMVAIYNKHCAGEDAIAETKFMQELGRRIDPLPFPLNVHAAIAARGLNPGAPKNPVSDETRQLCGAVTAAVRELLANSGS